MRRFFGAAKPQAPGPSLNDMGETLEKRATSLDERIKKLDVELIGYRDQLKKTKSPAITNQIKQKAARVMQQKKMYETQREQLMSQRFNLEQASFAAETMMTTAMTVQSMRDANKTMKQQFKATKIEDIEDLYDDMEDLLETNNEIQDTLSRSFASPYDIDEADLEDELNALGDLDELEELEGENIYAAEPSRAEPTSATSVRLPGVNRAGTPAVATSNPTALSQFEF
eukprot:TRINITY_DN4568_c0_g1_i1.p1 TRINITY_DN4568_c0_g1~~TRINITY_DN4568_c0_g1_i1.p1  ORF type:complete len:228 (-),score=45.95 TRINITY_DN4568_c0_g1_i1:894-1577(-)